MDGPTNMARDEILLEQADRYASATIRWYRWSSATLSLGYFQQDEQTVHPELPRVRRLSGGGAIIHDDEWTYSITAPRGVFADARQLYSDVHSILIEQICNLGCSVKMRGIDRPEIDDNFLCFDRGDRHDVVATAGDMAGKKVIGSAQRRRGKAVLQHGSVHFAKIFKDEDSRTFDQLVSFEDFCTVSSHELIARSAHLSSIPSWSTGELETAAQWATKKYDNLTWCRELRRGPVVVPEPPTPVRN